VTLQRGRIYILPTGLGLAFGVMLFAMLLGSLNYGNNLGLALTFLLGALGVVAMHACHRNLESLVARASDADPPFAGQDALFRIAVANPGRCRDVTSRPPRTARRKRRLPSLRRRIDIHAARADAPARQHRARAGRDRDALPLRPIPRLGRSASRDALPRLSAARA
jgi:hypothetical protein